MSDQPGPVLPNATEDPDTSMFHDHHEALDVADVMVDGTSTVVIAQADAYHNQVIIRLPLEHSEVTLTSANGINGPQGVTLAYVQGSAYPDLFVANTGGNNVLIFPGLPNGTFGPEINGNHGFPAGTEPVNVAVAQNGDGMVQISVANQGSGDVTIADAKLEGDTWTTTPERTISTGKQPVLTFIRDINGEPSLLVCNSQSDTVTEYASDGDGSFLETPVKTFDVGKNPHDMFVGHFDDRPGLDLITVNTGSNDLTFISDAFSSQATTQTIASGGTSPFVGFAIDPGQTGISDLVVANGGDGHMALFRGGSNGLVLADVITPSDVPNPTGLAPSDSGGNGFDFYAASAGTDAAQLLHFDLAFASAFLPVTTSESTATARGDSEIFAQLMALDGSSVELIAVFWAGSPGAETDDSSSNLHEPSTITALYTPTEGQGLDGPEKLLEGSSGLPVLPLTPLDPTKIAGFWVDPFVSGVYEALATPRGYPGAIALGDLPDEGADRRIEGLARLDSSHLPGERPFFTDAGADAGPGLVDEAIRLFWSDGSTREAPGPDGSPSKLDPSRELDGIDAPAVEVRIETLPLISAAVAASTRLILKASPPRPSMFGKKAAPRWFGS